jgi:hypothetical protein
MRDNGLYGWLGKNSRAKLDLTDRRLLGPAKSVSACLGSQDNTDQCLIAHQIAQKVSGLCKSSAEAGVDSVEIIRQAPKLKAAPQKPEAQGGNFA